MADYSEAAETIWAYANGSWFHDGAAGVPYVRSDITERQIEELRADVKFFREQFDDQVKSREEAEADKARLSEALTEIETIITDATGRRLPIIAQILDVATAALSGSGAGAGGWREPNSGHVYSAADLARLMEWRDKFIVSKGLWGEFVATLPLASKEASQ